MQQFQQVDQQLSDDNRKRSKSNDQRRHSLPDVDRFPQEIPDNPDNQQI